MNIMYDHFFILNKRYFVNRVDDGEVGGVRALPHG